MIIVYLGDHGELTFQHFHHVTRQSLSGQVLCAIWYLGDGTYLVHQGINTLLWLSREPPLPMWGSDLYA